MKRLALTLAAAVLGTGCIITDDDYDPAPIATGSVIVYWDFVRYAPASGGNVFYDASLVGTGSICEESFVDRVVIDSPAGRTADLPCVYQGVQGATIDYVPAGSRVIRVEGYRQGVLVYEGASTVSVLANQTVTLESAPVDLLGVPAPIDIVAYFSYAPDTFWATCDEAGNPEVDYEISDSFPTLIATGTVACPAGASAFPLDVFISDLELDNYTIRMKGFIGATREYDSCTSEALKAMAFDHFGAQTGQGGIPITLFEPVACTP